MGVMPGRSGGRIPVVKLKGFFCLASILLLIRHKGDGIEENHQADEAYLLFNALPIIFFRGGHSAGTHRR